MNTPYCLGFLQNKHIIYSSHAEKQPRCTFKKAVHQWKAGAACIYPGATMGARCAPQSAWRASGRQERRAYTLGLPWARVARPSRSAVPEAGRCGVHIPWGYHGRALRAPVSLARQWQAGAACIYPGATMGARCAPQSVWRASGRQKRCVYTLGLPWARVARPNQPEEAPKGQGILASLLGAIRVPS